jgi:hypothetical protein
VAGQKMVNLIERGEISEAANFAANRKTLDADDERLAAMYSKMPETFETVLAFSQFASRCCALSTYGEARAAAWSSAAS